MLEEEVIHRPGSAHVATTALLIRAHVGDQFRLHRLLGYLGTSVLVIPHLRTSLYGPHCGQGPLVYSGCSRASDVDLASRLHTSPPSSAFDFVSSQLTGIFCPT